jgi:hypothetical protein
VTGSTCCPVVVDVMRESVLNDDDRMHMMIEPNPNAA